jgi:ribosomal protein L7/L12
LERRERDQVKALEEQVRLLAVGLGVEVDDPRTVIGSEVVALARSGKQVQAVKALRRSRKLGLVAAKRIVDAAGG